MFAESVESAWGEPLQGDVCFRVVFYTVPRRIPVGQIRDPRIAMAVPRRAADPARETLNLEIRAIREAKESYVTGRGPDVQAVRSSMEEQEASLLGELARRESVSYEQGRVYTHTSTKMRPSEIFLEASVGSWVDRLVQALFQRAYPSLPFQYNEFPGPLTADKISGIYRGLFQGDQDAAETVASFGPVLGLTTRDAPTVFEASRCPVVNIIVEELGRRDGEMPARDLLQGLCREHGLNWPLATLYLLAYVRQADAEVELTPDHSLQSRRGGPFLSDRIPRDLVQELIFTESMGDQFTAVRAQPSVDWNAVVPYASLLIEGLKMSRDAVEIAEQEAQLSAALDEMARRIDGLREAMSSLAAGLQENAESALTALSRLEGLNTATDYRGFHTVARDRFGAPSGLSQALQLCYRLERLAALAPAITGARRYLDAMTFDRGHRDLAVKRDAVAGRMALDSLMSNPSLWDSVEESFRQLRREYADAYLPHHARYHHEAAELVSRLERIRPQVGALARFNQVPEFGGPLGADIPNRFEEMLATIRTCTATEDEIAVEAVPLCQTCLLPMNEDIRRREAALVLDDTERAMRAYNRRLSSEGVGLILADPTKEQLDKFINLIQVSDLSALANVLDEEVLEFLRRFVSRG